MPASNDDDACDSFGVHGCKSSGGDKVTYFKGTTGATALTRAVVGVTYELSQAARRVQDRADPESWKVRPDPPTGDAG